MQAGMSAAAVTGGGAHQTIADLNGLGGLNMGAYMNGSVVPAIPGWNGSVDTNNTLVNSSQLPPTSSSAQQPPPSSDSPPPSNSLPSSQQIQQENHQNQQQQQDQQQRHVQPLHTPFHASAAHLNANAALIMNYNNMLLHNQGIASQTQQQQIQHENQCLEAVPNVATTAQTSDVSSNIEKTPLSQAEWKSTSLTIEHNTIKEIGENSKGASTSSVGMPSASSAIDPSSSESTTMDVRRPAKDLHVEKDDVEHSSATGADIGRTGALHEAELPSTSNSVPKRKPRRAPKKISGKNIKVLVVAEAATEDPTVISTSGTLSETTTNIDTKATKIYRKQPKQTSPPLRGLLASLSGEEKPKKGGGRPKIISSTDSLAPAAKRRRTPAVSSSPAQVLSQPLVPPPVHTPSVAISVEMKAKLTRDRNREHARHTRLRKKAYVSKLKDLVEDLHAERTEEDRRRREMTERRRVGDAARRRTARTFLEWHCGSTKGASMRRRSVSVEDWSTILEEDIVFRQPITPYRSFRRSEIEGEWRVVRGIAGVMADRSSMDAMVRGIASRSGTWGEMIWKEFRGLLGHTEDNNTSDNSCGENYDQEKISPRCNSNAGVKIGRSEESCVGNGGARNNGRNCSLMDIEGKKNAEDRCFMENEGREKKRKIWKNNEEAGSQQIREQGRVHDRPEVIKVGCKVYRESPIRAVQEEDLKEDITGSEEADQDEDHSSEGLSSSIENERREAQERSSAIEMACTPSRSVGASHCNNGALTASETSPLALTGGRSRDYHEYNAPDLPDPPLIVDGSDENKSGSSERGSDTGEESRVGDVNGSADSGTCAAAYLGVGSRRSIAASAVAASSSSSIPMTSSLSASLITSSTLFRQGAKNDKQIIPPLTTSMSTAAKVGYSNVPSSKGSLPPHIAKRGGIVHNVSVHNASVRPRPRARPVGRQAVLLHSVTPLPPFSGLGKRPRTAQSLLRSRDDGKSVATAATTATVGTSTTTPSTMTVSSSSCKNNKIEGPYAHIPFLHKLSLANKIPSQPPTRITAKYHLNEDDMLLSSPNVTSAESSVDAVSSRDMLMCPFVLRTSDAVSCGAYAECVMTGMMRCSFSPRNKIDSIWLVYDSMGFMQQLERASGCDRNSGGTGGRAQIVPNSLEMALSPCSSSSSEGRVITTASEPYEILNVNDVWSRMTKYSQAEVEGLGWKNVVWGKKTESSIKMYINGRNGEQQKSDSCDGVESSSGNIISAFSSATNDMKSVHCSLPTTVPSAPVPSISNESENKRNWSDNRLYNLKEVSEGRCICTVAIHYDKEGKEYLNFVSSYPIANVDDKITHMIHVCRELGPSLCNHSSNSPVTASLSQPSTCTITSSSLSSSFSSYNNRDNNSLPKMVSDDQSWS